MDNPIFVMLLIITAQGSDPRIVERQPFLSMEDCQNYAIQRLRDLTAPQQQITVSCGLEEDA